jgi:hypothetical protein
MGTTKLKTFLDWALKKAGNFETSEIPEDMLLQELLSRYEATKIPPCRICGGKLSVQRCGGGEPTVYACSPNMYDEKDNPILKPGRNGSVDKHYRDSEFIDYKHGGDSLVIELIDRYRKTKSLM